MTVTLDIPSDLESYLREEAKRHGQDIADYIQHILRDQVAGSLGSAGHETSIMDLHGIGKKAWQGRDAQEYVDKLRDEWSRPA